MHTYEWYRWRLCRIRGMERRNLRVARRNFVNITAKAKFGHSTLLKECLPGDFDMACDEDSVNLAKTSDVQLKNLLWMTFLHIHATI